MVVVVPDSYERPDDGRRFVIRAHRPCRRPRHRVRDGGQRLRHRRVRAEGRRGVRLDASYRQHGGSRGEADVADGLRLRDVRGSGSPDDSGELAQHALHHADGGQDVPRFAREAEDDRVMRGKVR